MILLYQNVTQIPKARRSGVRLKKRPIKSKVVETNKIMNNKTKIEELGQLYHPVYTQNGVVMIKDKKDSELDKNLPEEFTISVKDREIRINDYIIGKPHAAGSNFEFFDYIRSQAPHTKINRNELPSKFGNLSIQERVRNKRFVKILNELGFKGEILKAFFYKRGKNTISYRGDKITKKDLGETGIKTQLFLKELEVAHIRNSPE